MSQLFRDQHRQAIANHGAVGLFRLWLRVLADLAISSCRERLSELHHAMNKPLSQTPLVTFLTVFAISSMLIGGFLFIALKFFVPTVYTSRARIALETSKTDGTYDPYAMQTHFERIISPLVLNQVIDELRLGNWLNQQAHSTTPLSERGAYEVLKEMVTIRPYRNTSLAEVSVFSQDRVMASEIANRIVEVYRQTAEKGPLMETRVEVVDRAEPALRPIRPNIPLNVFFGFVISLALAAVAFLYRFISRRHSKSATPG